MKGLILMGGSTSFFNCYCCCCSFILGTLKEFMAVTAILLYFFLFFFFLGFDLILFLSNIITITISPVVSGSYFICSLDKSPYFGVSQKLFRFLFICNNLHVKDIEV